MAYKLTDQNLRYFRDVGFSLEEMPRLFDLPLDIIRPRLLRLNRVDGIESEPVPDATAERARAVATSRPWPPKHLLDPDRIDQGFACAEELRLWIQATFLEPRGPLYNADHAHLLDATIGVLWTNVPLKMGGKVVAATAEIPSFQGNAFARARAERALLDLLDMEELPDFVLHFDTLYAERANDVTFCARVDHELYHCAQKVNRWGGPCFSPVTGLPSFRIVAHDCEEFVGVVRRFGFGAAAAGTAQLVAAAALPPLLGDEKIEMACGTCRR